MPGVHRAAFCSTWYSSVSPTHGEQEMSPRNGHHECICYHPLFVFNQFGDLERCALRPGNVHSADGWEGALKPVLARYRGKVSRIYFRADASFANPEVYEYLEGEGIKYAIRLPANRVLREASATCSSALSAARPTMSGASTRT
jgi:Transposase DDE domain group 1